MDLWLCVLLGLSRSREELEARAGEMQREKTVLEATVRGLEQRLEEEVRRSARLTEGLESAQRDVADRVSEGMPATSRGWFIG